ncbi:MAG: rhomboid family intramembrane serine protease [Muribaculaceae bacterium]
MKANDIKKALWGKTVNRLLTVNVAVFVILTAGSLIAPLLGCDAALWVSQFALPSSPLSVLTRPWTALLYMVSHANVVHLLFNMVWLYCFGRLLESVSTGSMVVTAYVSGGLVGGIAYVCIWPLVGSAAGVLLGASAAVISVAVALAVRVPDMKVNMMIIGQVAIKWVVAVVLVLFGIGLAGANMGGNIAHLAGAATGLVVGLNKKIGRERARRVGAGEASAPFTAADRAELDRLLDKVRHSGYASLSAAERRRLFDISGRIK